MWEQLPGPQGLIAILIASVVLATGCPPTPPNKPGADALYRDLGEIDGLRPIVDELAWRLATDDVIGKELAKGDIGSLKESILLFLCVRTGGPCIDAGERPLIPTSVSPSAAARRLSQHLKDAAITRGASPALATKLSDVVIKDARAFIGPRRAGPASASEQGGGSQ